MKTGYLILVIVCLIWSSTWFLGADKPEPVSPVGEYFQIEGSTPGHW